MKAPLIATFAALSWGGFVFAESAIPAAFPRDRYNETLSTSPFALATPPPDKVEEKPDSPLNNLVVAGMGKLDDGRDFVIVQRIGDDRAMRFEGNTPNAEGLAVKEVKWAEKWKQSTVIMTHDKEQRAIEFNQSAVASAPPQPPGGIAGRRGPAPTVNAPPPIVPSGLNSAARTTTNQRPPSITPTIPRPGAVQVPRPGAGAQLNTNFRGAPNLNQGNNTVPMPTNGAAPRTRVRSIDNR